MSGRKCRALRTTIGGAWAVAFFLTIGLGGAVAGTRLITHFENSSNADLWGRDVLRDFYNSQGAAVATNLYPNVDDNLAPFPLVSGLFTSGGSVSSDPFEIHQFDTDGTVPGPGFLTGENRFAAFGAGWSLGAQDQVRDFHINFISVANENNDYEYVPGTPPVFPDRLADNTVTGTVQDWTSYDFLCFYLCINASSIPPQQFFDDFKIQLWEYAVEVSGAPLYTVTRDDREIYEVSLTEVLSNMGMQRFTGWRHLRIPLTTPPFTKRGNVTDPDDWRYALTVSQGALDDPLMSGTGNLDKNAIRAIIFRKDRILDTNGNPTEPDNRITVAIDEIAVTGSTSAEVLRVNVPGATGRCTDNQDQGLCWAQLFPLGTYDPDDPNDPNYQVRPFTNPAQPAVGNVDVVVTVRDWQELWATFSAEVGNGAVVSATDVSSEMVFVPQFQAPGTWVERWTAGPDFLRRKGTMQVPGPPARQYLFYTDWRYDYTNGAAAEHYLVRYNPAGGTPFARLDPSAFPYGGFLANYFREFGYAYGTLFVLPRDAQGNIGRAQVIDVLFQQATPRQLRFERLMTGQP
jgi:hypothetical protein